MRLKIKARTWLAWIAIVLLTVLPLWLAGGAAFGGADDLAREAIGTIAPGYAPWFSPVFEPASGEIASLLFALQAALGAGVIGYWLGLSVGRERARAAAGKSDAG
ncbi:energy-coupling factor ABC transporter substrate-binding protein [Pseudoduganella albidiflava]|uniref:Cobalt transport protein CbiN n=1 Tax=Pseudoduganella albidiflava TaxID=321983 RepID=A0A411X0Z8_9BURK|nr:energy-coupling factor ABC transporter substrate-binding protein [Pseudoduganella albidiflava]QBI02643.1 energy-coupling factor ABC transporter substrate-binding protein [Pseudoduganella albidiflava]GGY41037.1 cobalt ABC transporter substrate-binding protein CbiN [Pseudoduganella albidiflava]